MTTFTRFTELPRELRDQIWSLAIRDDHPGAHIFGQYGTGSRHILSQYGPSFDVAAPSWSRYFESLDENRSDENISTYLVDGGLWTTCHESRCIMEKHFRQSRRQLAPRHLNDRRESFSEKDRFRMAESGYFDGNPLEIVTVFPRRDLFIFQLEDLDKIDWGYLDFGFCGVGHIAIEYDRAWGDGYHTDWVVNRALFNACVEASYTFWFIDRSLKRKSQAPVFEEESDCSWKLNAFYASDRKFLEIKDDGTPMENWEYVGPLENSLYDHLYDSLEFVRGLKDDLIDKSIADGSEAEDPCVIGLLGWAPL
ncbi:uncharacterized protein FMAN_11703 [Fusarium mangiferae]|uniref:2EXR domain-containing protein n=1 Tax=Fusarium mangiferae TaxID=192010 RepID=A0A1L7TIG9_FUSMA|nr:uncharacterized protein FMAN_11703 [Fusarium mangiferae]CVK97709.1 uncharacterized protein FMAN_11703 [Fusarium mangiferae]